MSIRFKFRSSVNYDTVDIDGRSSITVRELRSKIIRCKSLNICQDFDLVFSDADSGREYDDENFRIPSGSSVIIKRVPAGTARSAVVPIDATGSFQVKGLYSTNSTNDQMDKFDDFGADLYPGQAAMPHLDIEFEKNISGGDEKANVTGLRSGCAEVRPVEWAIQNGGGRKGNIIDDKSTEEQLKLQKSLHTNTAALQDMGLPSELKCSLCDTYFKDAVMIPCCQHSFCDKCIRQVLVRKARCPKCLSDKYNVESLLPNLSLRQAIEHFLESQILNNGSENAFNRYAPDGESGIQAKDASCTVTVIQREPELPHSPSATGKGSNIILPESFYDSGVRRNASFGPSDYNFNNNAAGREASAPKMQKGENNLRQNNFYDEADSKRNRMREMWIDHGGDGSFRASGRQIKGNRTCYMCGSPDHLIRDCPFSSGSHPMLQSGYASSYWNSAAFPHLGPFPNMYGNPVMMPFNASLGPVTTYRVPPYAPNMYGGLPARGIMRIGTLATPRGNRAEQPLDHADVELQHAEKKQKLSSDYLGRGQNGDVEDDFHQHNPYCEPERSHEYRVHREREASGNHSEDSFARRSCKKNHLGQHGDSDNYSFDGFHQKSSRSSISGRDRKSYPSERSGPVREHSHTGMDKHGKERSKHHHRGSKRHHENWELARSDSNRGQRYQSGKEGDVRCRVDSDVRGSHKKHDRCMESDPEPISSGDKRRQRKDRDSGLEIRHPRQDTKCKNRHPYDDGWQMVSCSDEDRGDDYHHRKWKRKRKRGH